MLHHHRVIRMGYAYFRAYCANYMGLEDKILHILNLQNIRRNCNIAGLERG